MKAITDRPPLAQVIHVGRRVLGWSMQDVADRTGISPERIFRIEHGRTKPYEGELEKLALVLGRPELLDFIHETKPRRRSTKEAA
jgi:transcriptional regulator with XRE-family HTH domain